MPTCIVPRCNNTEKNSPWKFFRLPVNEKDRNEWIQRIRRGDNYKYSYNDRICSWHFPGQKKDGPSRFAWNKDKNFALVFTGPNTGLAKNHPEKIKTHSGLKSSEKPTVVKNFEGQKDIAELNVEATQEIEYSPLSGNRKMLLAKLEKLKAKQNAMEQENSRLKNYVRDVDFKNKYLVRRVAMLEKSKALMKMRKSRLPSSHVNKLITEATLEGKTGQTVTKFDIETLEKWDTELLSSFTGMQDISSIKILTEILKRKQLSYSDGSTRKKLPLDEQVILSLIKLRLNLPHKVLAYLFLVSKATISVVFNCILKAIYQVFYEGGGPLSKIPPRANNLSTLPTSFQAMSNCRIIIDCTEFTMQSPAKLYQKKAVYSHYKGRYTMKALIGCAPNGTVSFVSNLYGGSESDKSIVIKSGLLNHMNSGDMILADKGFQLYDILPPGVSLNIPSFLRSNQFTVNEISENNVYTKARVIVERLNAKLKIFKILSVVKAKDCSKADLMIKVCTALTTLMPTLQGDVCIA